MTASHPRGRPGAGGVFAGGAAGSAARYLLVVGCGHAVATTLVINVVGSGLLGLLAGRAGIAERWRLVLGTGVLGGFTTYSALAVSTARSLGSSGVPLLVLSVGAGAAAARLGLAAGRRR